MSRFTLAALAGLACAPAAMAQTMAPTMGATHPNLAAAHAAASYNFKLIATIPLPTKPGHGDWVAYDPSNHDVYVSLNGSGMAVVDTRTDKVIHGFANIPEPNTMTFDDNYIYETAAEGPGAGKVNQIVVIDKKTWKVVDRINTVGTTPDGTFIDKANDHLYVVSDDSNAIDVYTTGPHPTFITKFPLKPAHPKQGPDVAVLFHGTIYATDDAWVEKLNPTTGAISAAVNYHLKLTDEGGTKDMFWDKMHHAIWVATTTGGVMVINPNSLRVEKRLPETAGADEVAADPALGLVYVFEGGTPGFDVYSIKEMKRIDTVRTGIATPTHSGAVDPETHEIFVYAGGNAALDVYKPVRQ
jgi:DNA-binding beta-propeller fold protein YncE